MKKTIMLFLLIGIMVVSIVSSELILSNEMQSKKLDNETSTKIQNVYSNTEKNMIIVKGYIESKDHVIISFENTTWRVITSKKKFEGVLK